jgi:hypothetical protein
MTNKKQFFSRPTENKIKSIKKVIGVEVIFPSRIHMHHPYGIQTP